MEFFYMNGKFPATNRLSWVPKGDNPEFNSVEILSLKRLYEFFIETRSHALVSVQFLAALNLFLSKKAQISKNGFSELYKNLSLQVLSKKEIAISVDFDSITELVKEVNNSTQNSIFANR